MATYSVKFVLVLAVAVAIAAIVPRAAWAQSAPPAGSAQPLSAPTIRALQDALVKQGIPVKVDGVMSEELRAAIRKYQSQHHLPVTGEADKATLDKLGVAVSSGAAAPSAAPAAGGMPGQGKMMGPGMMEKGMMGGGMMQGGQGMPPAKDTPKP